MCCGSKRSALRYGYAAASAVSTPAGDAAPPLPRRVGVVTAQGRAAAIASLSTHVSPTTVLLCCRESSSMRVRGPVTGKMYEFSRSQPALLVEMRDAAAMSRSGTFYRP